MAYTANKYRKENTNPIPMFEVDGVVITSKQYMHGEWWYVVEGTWECESNMSNVLNNLKE